MWESIFEIRSCAFMRAMSLGFLGNLGRGGIARGEAPVFNSKPKRPVEVLTEFKMLKRT